MPGPTDTEFFHSADMDDTKVGAGEKDDPAEVAREGYEALMASKDRHCWVVQEQAAGYRRTFCPIEFWRRCTGVKRNMARRQSSRNGAGGCSFELGGTLTVTAPRS